MNGTARQVKQALRSKSDPEKAAVFPRFFKSGPGEYGEGDQFLGVIVPDLRAIGRQYKLLPFSEIETLLDSPLHECRLTGLFILVHQFEASKTEAAKKSIYDFYLRKADRVNNWDLVDSSAHKIVGPYLLNKSHQPLFKLARANHLWKNRIAMIATLHFIKSDKLETTIELAVLLLDHPHDLIHKAVGWMLRELGKRNKPMLLLFLRQHAPTMPRTMLRYAIEKLDEPQRQAFLKMKPGK